MITLDIAEAISDPNLYWRCDFKSKGKCDKLDFAQREWALTLILTTSRLYKEVRDEQGAITRTELIYLNLF